MSRSALIFAASAAALALLVGYAEASADKLPTDKKPSDWTQAEMEAYGLVIIVQTAGFGFGLAALYGLFECVCCCYCCCAAPPSKALKKKNPHFDQFSEFNDKWSKKLPSPKWFFIGAAAFLLAFVATTLGTWGYWTEYKVAMVDTYDGVQTLTTEFAGFLCSEDYGTNCADDTIGDFLEDAKVEAGSTLDQVSLYLEGLDELTQGLDNAVQEADNAIQYLNDMDDTIDRINANITAANNILADLQSNPDVDDDIKAMLPEEIDEVDDGTIFDDAIDMILNSQTTATNIQLDLDDFYDDTINDLLLRIDGDENTGDTDDRVELFNTIDDILESIMDTRDDILDISQDIEDNHDTVVMVFDYLVLGVSLFFAIPCIIMLITTTMSKLCCKVAPIYMTMSFTYLFQVFFCFAAGMTLFFAILWNDVCVVHDDVIKVTIGNYTTKIRDTEVELYGTVMDLLKCGHNPNSDVDQNFAAILGVEQEFNVSEYVDPVIEEMYEVRDYVLNQTVIVEESIELIDEVVDTFVNFAVNTESYSTNVTTAIAEIDNLLAELPSYDMGGNRDDTTEQAKVEQYYDAFSFAAYQPLVDAVNFQLGLMANVPTPFNTLPLTFETIKDLTPTVMTSADWFDSDDGVCDALTGNCADYGSTTYDDVNDAVNAAYVMTDALNMIISGNNDLIDELLELRQYLVNIDNDIQVLEAQEQALMASTDGITASLEGMIDDIEDAANGIDALVVEVYDIIDFVATAPEYLGCKWLGNFYVNTIKGSFCTDSVDALFNASAPMVSVPTLMMLFFCFAAIYIPVLKDVKYQKKNQKALGDAFDVENNATAPPPPTLALVDAVPEQKTNELEMGTIKGGDDSRPSSSRRKKMDFN